MGHRGSLTEREKELMNWCKKGLSYSEIAKRMDIQYASASGMAQNIRRKLRIDRNVTLAMYIKGGIDV